MSLADRIQRFAEAHLFDFAINLVTAVLVFWLGRKLARMLSGALGKALRKSNVDDSLCKFASDLAYMLLLAVVIIASLDRLGVPTTSAVAIVGAAGLAVGLALQGSLGNFASGVMIILFKPYKVGDIVTIAGSTGKVEGIKVFSTLLHTPDNRELIVPNGAVTAGTIENLTALGTRRVDMVFGIGYDDDIKKAKQLLEKIVADDSRILAEPAPAIAVSELADSSVNFIVRPWVNVADYWGVMFDVTETVKATFDAEGISIPYPQQDVHMHEVKKAG